MTILTCRYCKAQCLDKDVMKIYDYPEDANWFGSHYLKCVGIRKSQKCLCGDLSKRCRCKDCYTCIKTSNSECQSEFHPKNDKEVCQIKTLESFCNDQEKDDYLIERLKIMRLRHITPLSEIVKTSR
jgi:hypothetical protein